MIVQGQSGTRRRIRGAEEGTADLVGFVKKTGRYLEVELKKKGGKLRPAQVMRREALERTGAAYAVIDAGMTKEQVMREVDTADARALYRALDLISKDD